MFIVGALAGCATSEASRMEDTRQGIIVTAKRPDLGPQTAADRKAVADCQAEFIAELRKTNSVHPMLSAIEAKVPDAMAVVVAAINACLNAKNVQGLFVGIVAK